ncbi:MAG: DNA polymerase domain-containing protein [Chloroflexota bacterium]
MLRPAPAGLPHASSQSWDAHHVAGCDPTEGIVSVEADNSGRARIWRRVDGRVEVSEQRFPNWFLATGLDLLAHLAIRPVDAEVLRRAHGRLDEVAPPPDGVSVVELDGTLLGPDDEAYRYLVLVDNFDDVSTALAEMSNKRDGAEAQSLNDLRGMLLSWSPAEQFLMLSGRTFFKGMHYGDLRRLQFDLETTGLDEDRDRIFMISMSDSTGWRESLDTGSWSEARLIERFVEAIQARDPDVLENHNIFGFDLPFLARRAARLGVRLRLGRDGTEPKVETDVFAGAERSEPFLRWRIVGREVVDTQHAVRRYGAVTPELRRYGLKEAARFLGLAHPDREYVAGIDVWPTYREDPERVRRYAAADVDEVDGLSRRLLPPIFGLAQCVPRPYERLAADCSPASIWEPLLARAYLHTARALGVAIPRDPPSARPTAARVFVSGVVRPAARVTAVGLIPRLVTGKRVRARVDTLGVLPDVVGWALSRQADEATQLIANSAHAHLGGSGLLSDQDAAAEVTATAGTSMMRIAAALTMRGCEVVEIDGPHLSCAVPSTWSVRDAKAISEDVRESLPPGVELTWSEMFESLYSRGPRNSIVLGTDGRVTLVGAAFRPGRTERFGEAFVLRFAPNALRGDVPAAREVFLETVHALRTNQIPLSDLCVQVTLHKSPPQYRRAGIREEPYEVLLAAGVRSWRVGQRIRYFRAHGREPHLSVEGDALTALDADTEFYVQRLVSSYCAVFDKAFRRDDAALLFQVPAGVGPYRDGPAERSRFAQMRPISGVVADT